MAEWTPILQVYSVGETTVVGFGGRDVLDSVNVANCREELLALIEKEHCKVLGVDLTGVKFIPSGLLGVLASVRKLGVEVHLYNPSSDVREAMTATNLDKIMPMHEIELPPPASSGS